MTPNIKNTFRIMSNIKQKTGSSSDMYIVENKSTGDEFFLKLAVKKTDQGETPEYYFLFQNEKWVYNYLKKELIGKYHSRNILPIESYGNLNYEQWFEWVRDSPITRDLSDGQIDRNLLLITEFMMEERDNHQPIDSNRSLKLLGVIQNIDKFRYSYIMTPLIKGDYLNFGLLLGNLSSIQEVCKYTCVLLFTIHQLLKVGVNHNDLHFGNILVRNFQPCDFESKTYLLVTPENTFIVDLPYTLILFDFDRSVIKNKHNPYLEEYALYGNCPDFHPRRDILKVICNLFRFIKWYIVDDVMKADPSEMMNFLDYMLEQLISDEYIRERIRETTNCFLEMDDDLAIGCREEYLDRGVSSIGKALGFFLRQANFKQVSTPDLIQNNPVALELATKKLSKNFSDRFTKTYPNLNRYVKANIQFTELFKGRKTLVRNVRDFIAQSIQ
jgi:hypothetical protein